MLMKTITIVTSFLFFLGAAAAAENTSLINGFGKTSWGMTQEEIISIYQIVLAPPRSADPGGVWAFVGPAPGELTVSGEALGDQEIRSVSFGIHPKLGLAIAHIRFRDTNDPEFVEKLLPKWMGRLGEPKARFPGPKVVWEKESTHIELTYHTVSPRHPSPTDHLAIVLWNIPLMKKIESEMTGEAALPDVEKLRQMQQPHKETSE